MAQGKVYHGLTSVIFCLQTHSLRFATSEVVRVGNWTLLVVYLATRYPVNMLTTWLSLTTTGGNSCVVPDNNTSHPSLTSRHRYNRVQHLLKRTWSTEGKGETGREGERLVVGGRDGEREGERQGEGDGGNENGGPRESAGRWRATEEPERKTGGGGQRRSVREIGGGGNKYIGFVCQRIRTL